MTKTKNTTATKAPKADAPKANTKADSKATKATKAPAKAADAPKAPKANPDAFAIHVNKTGRVCFGKDAAQRLNGSPYATLTVDGKTVRIEPKAKEVDGALTVRDGGGRPYISATKQFKPLGFDGSRPYDIEAKPYGNAGFEFKLQ